jgi:hypothetical protein
MSAKWYTPQLSRELVARLYFKAKAERIPMTTLVNRIVKQALDTERGAEPQLHSNDAMQGSVPDSGFRKAIHRERRNVSMPSRTE